MTPSILRKTSTSYKPTDGANIPWRPPGRRKLASALFTLWLIYRDSCYDAKRFCLFSTGFPVSVLVLMPRAGRAGINKQEPVIVGRIKTEFLPTHRRPRARRAVPRESTDSLDLPPMSTVGADSTAPDGHALVITMQKGSLGPVHPLRIAIVTRSAYRVISIVLRFISVLPLVPWLWASLEVS